MIRYATLQDIPDVNRLRAQVGEMHAEALPDLFKPVFPQPLQDYAYHMLESENTEILVCERDGAEALRWWNIAARRRRLHIPHRKSAISTNSAWTEPADGRELPVN